MLTVKEAYEQWQTMIMASHTVQVDTAKIYAFLEAHMTIPDRTCKEVQEHINTLRFLLNQIEQSLELSKASNTAQQV